MAAPASSHPRILLVEDTADHAFLYRRYLARAPIELHHVTTGGAALAHIEDRVPPVLQPPPAARPLEDRTGPIRPLRAVEREAIEGAIALCDGNITRAADLLGVNASTIYRKRAAWSGGA